MNYFVIPKFILFFVGSMTTFIYLFHFFLQAHEKYQNNLSKKVVLEREVILCLMFSTFNIFLFYQYPILFFNSGFYKFLCIYLCIHFLKNLPFFTLVFFCIFWLNIFTCHLLISLINNVIHICSWMISYHLLSFKFIYIHSKISSIFLSHSK